MVSSGGQGQSAVSWRGSGPSGMQCCRRRCARGWREGNEGERQRGLREAGGGIALVSMEGIDRLLTAAEVAERLGYSERYVWRLGREGVLPRIKVPGRKYVRFSEADVARFVRASRQAAAPPVSRARRAVASRPAPRRF